MLQLRYAGIPYKDLLVPGLCISAPSKDDALQIARMAQAYFEQPGPKETSFVSFVGERDDTYTFIFDFGSRIGAVEISGVDGSIVRDLLQGLERFRYFGVFLGFSTEDGEFEIIDPKTFHLFRGEVVVDGEVCRGKDVVHVDWGKLVSRT